MNKCKFEVGKTYKTRDGRDVRIVAVIRNTFPLVGIFAHNDMVEDIAQFTLKGEYYMTRQTNNLDLIPPEPEKHVMWLNIYPDDVAHEWESRERADREAMDDRIACIRIEYHEGEGL